MATLSARRYGLLIHHVHDVQDSTCHGNTEGTSAQDTRTYADIGLVARCVLIVEVSSAPLSLDIGGQQALELAALP